MKSKKAAKGGSVPKSVDEYVAHIPENSRAAFGKLRTAIRSASPAEAIETISYGIPAIKHGRVLVWFGAFAKHCSLFPTNAVIEAFEDELAEYTVSKGTIQFPFDRPLPTALIKKMVKARVAQDAAKSK